jgi:TPP-dependent pyruvate/acetoin dehydrogenase alpha subunit
VLGFLVATNAAAFVVFGNDIGAVTVIVPLATLLILCAVFFAASIARRLSLPALIQSVTARSAGVETDDSRAGYSRN